MKKILLFVVLAVSACATLSAQDKVERFFNNIDRADRQITHMHKNLQQLGRAVGIKDRKGKPKVSYDYKTGITTEYRRGQVSSIYCDNLWLEVHETFVTVYQRYNNRWKCTQSLARDTYGQFTVANRVICGQRSGVYVNVTNNRERTMIWFWYGDQVIKGYTIRAGYQQSHKW